MELRRTRKERLAAVRCSRCWLCGTTGVFSVACLQLQSESLVWLMLLDFTVYDDMKRVSDMAFLFTLTYVVTQGIIILNIIVAGTPPLLPAGLSLRHRATAHHRATA